MRPFPAHLMRMWPISTRVNKPENDDPSIIEPIEPATDAAWAVATSLLRASTTLIHERHRFGSSHISFIKPLDAKPGILDQFINRAVQMTATGQTLPRRGEMILPPAHARFRRATMLDEEKTTAQISVPDASPVAHFGFRGCCTLSMPSRQHRHRDPQWEWPPPCLQ